jgi:hypothetical protein
MTAIVNTRSSLVALLAQLRDAATAQPAHALLALYVDSGAAQLSAPDWGALLSALTLPGAASLRLLDVTGLAPDLAAVVAPHAASVAQKLSQLHTFALRCAPLTPRAAAFIAASLRAHPALRRIVVEQCDLRDDGAVAFVTALLSSDATDASPPPPPCPALEVLDLGHNNVSAEGTAEVARLLRNGAAGVRLPTLAETQLRGNHHKAAAHPLPATRARSVTRPTASLRLMNAAAAGTTPSLALLVRASS